MLFTASDPPDAQPLQDSKSQHQFGHQGYNPLSTSTGRNDQGTDPLVAHLDYFRIADGLEVL